ncbi:hypothetical protein B5F10_00070 [Anaerotruncus colihominis]|uniref:Uncharacterized protein n=1 Tax=Anaerotruncus colihominis TaxID=169435 RepID=A0A1Y4N6V5_9FIRM|nr:hypothetical protein B5F11_17175 [Anaerotruncus colihominis]OUP76270.1 hypothetical protein B5F10_00070 [Anaerotruncus colihominis]
MRGNRLLMGNYTMPLRGWYNNRRANGFAVCSRHPAVDCTCCITTKADGKLERACRCGIIPG